MNRPLNVVFLEPYHGGSHAQFLETICSESVHHFVSQTLPARKWKWRMRGAALWFAEQAMQWLGGADVTPDLILCSDMLSVADLRSLLPRQHRNIPIVCYFHENQLTYPLAPTDIRDYQYGMTNITSCLASDAVWFNSHFHRNGFLEAAQSLLRKMPDHVPKNIVREISAKSCVVSPPIRSAEARTAERKFHGRLRILWCHRWEYDKNPKPFFQALCELADEGVDFEVVLLGEQFRSAPEEFRAAMDRLSGRIQQAGFIESRSEYLKIVSSCDIVVSTAIQENFGIAVVEAMLAGCWPLLPSRLVYPELIPNDLHDACLFLDDGALRGRLDKLLNGSAYPSADDRIRLTSHLDCHFGLATAMSRLDSALTAAYQASVSNVP